MTGKNRRKNFTYSGASLLHQPVQYTSIRSFGCGGASTLGGSHIPSYILNQIPGLYLDPPPLKNK